MGKLVASKWCWRIKPAVQGGILKTSGDEGLEAVKKLVYKRSDAQKLRAALYEPPQI